MQPCNPQGPSADEIVLSVPTMTCRHSVRAISGQIRDVAGVVAVEADVTSRTVRVHGTPQLSALRSAIVEAGYEAVEVEPGPAADRPGGSDASELESRAIDTS